MNNIISVIVPVYNAAQYINRCVSSIQAQTYNNFELILVNDGSTDNSLERCKELKKKDSRIKVIERKNGGASAARNTGLNLATGEYVVFVDADDFVSNKYLENLYRSVKESRCDIVQCEMESVFKEPEKPNEKVYSINDVEIITVEQALNGRKYKVCVWGKIYSSRVFKSYRFPEGTIYEDDASYYRLVYEAEGIAILKECLYFYYMSDDSVMRNKKKNKSLAFIEIYNQRIKFFEEKEEEALVEGTYIRYCIVLMLFMAEASYYHNNIDDINMLWELYKKNYYKIAKSPILGYKDKIILLSYRFAHKFMNPIIARIRR